MPGGTKERGNGMLKAISLAGRYLPGNSVLHRCCAGTKIMLCLLFMASLYTVESYGALAAHLLFTGVIAAGSGRPALLVAGALRPVLCLAGVAAIANLFMMQGEPLAAQGILSAMTFEGLHVSLRMLLRLCLMVAATTLLTRTTSPVALADGLERLLQPLRRLGLPVHETAMMLTIALRFIPTVVDEAEKIIRARRSRCASFGTGSLAAKARSFLPLLAPLFASAMRRGDALALAMEARCYQGAAGRTRMKRAHFSAADAVAVAVLLLFTAAVLFVEQVK